jgi:5-methylcytosine-specific restriction endonuclease McrA
MGGSKEKDVITNLMALCRDCHVRYGDRKEFKEFLVRKHQERLNGF